MRSKLKPLKMKKIVLSLLALASITMANAQSEFKPNQGDVTTEFGLSGGILNSELKLNDDDNKNIVNGGLLRFRYFATESMAFRVGLSVSHEGDTRNVYGGADQENEGTYKSKYTGLLMNLGVEKHFSGTERLSPYVGGDLLFQAISRKIEWDNSNLSGTSYQADNSGYRKGPGEIGVGLRGVVGADYYFAKRVFLGAEAGLGFLYSKLGKRTTKYNDDPADTYKSEGNSFEFSPSIVTGVRIGFVF